MTAQESPAVLQSSMENRYRQALFLVGEGKEKRAVERLKQLIGEDPSFFKPYRTVVEIYLENGRYNEGYRYFHKLLHRYPRLGPAHYALARLNYSQKNYDSAIRHLKKSIRLNPEYDEAYGPYGGLNEVYHARGNVDSAITFFSELSRRLPQNANARFGLGRGYLKKYQWQKALKYLNQALRIDPQHKYVFHSLIYIYEQLGQYEKTMESCRNLISAAQKDHALDQVSYAFSKIGGLYYYMGDYRNALTYFHKSLSIASKIGETRREGMAINNIGAAYAILGNYRMALRYFKHSLELLRQGGAVISEIRAIMNIGLIYKDLYEEKNALNYLYQALHLAEKSGHTIEKASILTGIGETFFQLERPDSARDHFEKALQIALKVDNKAQVAYISSHIGNVLYDSEKYEQALTYFKKALKLGQSINDAQIIWESETGAGVCYKQLEFDDKAEKHLSHAVAMFDSIRRSLDFESLGQGFLSDKYETYPALIGLYANNQNYAAAQDIIEKYKATTILKMITEGQPLVHTLLPDSVNIQIRKMNARLQSYHDQLSKEMAKPKPDKDKILQLDQSITDVQLKRAELKNWMKAHFAPFYQVTSAKSPGLNYLQDSIITEDQLMIEYIIGRDNIGALAITKDSIDYREFHVSREQLSQMLSGISPIFEKEHTERPLSNTSVINAELANFSIPPAFHLYQTILRPFSELLKEKSQLIVISDDLLLYFPFETLVVDTSNVRNRYDFKNAVFLIESHTVSYAPSASVLDPELYKTGEAPWTLLAMGNPDFSVYNGKRDALKMQARPAYDAGMMPNELRQLSNAEKEVQAIVRELDDSETDIYTGTTATEARFKTAASNYKIIHLATHFLVNDEDPLYSRIVLAKSEDSEQDGVLQPYELFTQSLKADLAVLSACNTALGKLRKGEGLIGISRAFQFAGVPSLVVSLWNVDDRAAYEVITGFYKYLKQGKDKNIALRLAKLDFLKSTDSEHHDPFYWAPFILMGDMQPVDLPTSKRLPGLVWITGFTMILVVVIFVLVRRFRG